MKRLDYIDNLKWVLIVLVIFHHAGQAYGDGGDWAYVPSNPGEYVEGLWRVFSLNAGFLMGLFFLISGYFAPGSYDRHGFKGFLRGKLFHIGIPLVFLFVFISVLAGVPEIAHGWYLLMLLIFSLFYGLFRHLSGGNLIFKPEGNGFPDLLMLLTSAVVLSVVEYFTRQAYPQDYWVTLSTVRLFEPAHLPQYVLMYVLGIYSYRRNLFENLSDQTGVLCLAAAAVIAFLMLFGFSSFDGCNWWAYESIFCISISFGLVWLFRRFMNFSNVFTRWCSAQEYGSYIFHLTNMLLIQHISDSLYLGGGIPKLLFIGFATTLFTFLTTALIRHIPAVRKVI